MGKSVKLPVGAVCLLLELGDELTKRYTRGKREKRKESQFKGILWANQALGHTRRILKEGRVHSKDARRVVAEMGSRQLMRIKEVQEKEKPEVSRTG